MSYRPRIISWEMKWNSCGNHIIILNTDGSYKKSIGKTGAGGIVRKRNGDMIITFANPLQFSTNHFTEARVVLNGIQWCFGKGMYKFKVELESMIIFHMIKGICSTHWKLTSIIEETRDRVREKQIEISH